MSGLPRGWVEATLEELFTLVRGLTYAKEDVSPKLNERHVALLRANNIQDGKIDFDDLIYLPRNIVKDEQIVRDGDIVMATSSGSRSVVGKAARVTEREEGITFGAFCGVVRPRYQDAGTYLFQYMRSRAYRDYVEAVAIGTNINNFRSSDIQRMALPLAPLAEQKRIVAKLDALNAKSARARTELARIETLVSRYKQAVLSKAFSGELTREWRARVKAIEPRIGTLEELLSVPVRNGLSVKGSDTPPGFPALRLSALREREVRLNDVRYIPVDDDKARRFLLETGDILVSRGNGTRSLVGIASLVPTVVRATIFPDTAFRIRVDGAKALPLWLTSLWNAPQVRSQIELVAKTTAGIWKISQKDLATIQLSIPSTLEEQHEIVRRIEAAFARIYRLVGEAKRALELVGRLDEAILAKAFRGELVPQDDNDEPAEKLLERIRSQRQATPRAGRGRGKV